MTDYAAVLLKLRPTSKFTLHGDDYAGLTWESDDPKPTKKTLDDAWPQVNYDQQHAAVEQQRRAAYQAQTDGMYFDAIRHAKPLTDWEQAVAAVKVANPYPVLP